MSRCLKQKLFPFDQAFDFSLVPHERPKNHLRISTQLNISRLKLKNDLGSSDYFFHHQSLSPLKNIGLGVTEKKTFPESSVCEITQISDVYESKTKVKQGFIDSFYTRRKASIKLLSNFRNQSAEENERFDTVTQIGEFNEHDGERNNSLTKMNHNSCRPILNIKSREIRRRAFFKCTRIKINPKSKAVHGNTISIQTEDH